MAVSFLNVYNIVTYLSYYMFTQSFLSCSYRFLIPTIKLVQHLITVLKRR